MCHKLNIKSSSNLYYYYFMLFVCYVNAAQIINNVNNVMRMQ